MWNKTGVKIVLLERLIISDYYFALLAKFEGLLQDLNQQIDFLEPWYGISKYIEAIFQYFWNNSNLLNLEAKPEPDLFLPLQVEQKAFL